MKKVCHFIVMVTVIVCTGSICSAGPAADPGEVKAVTAQIKSHAAKDPVESVFVNKIIGDFAEATVSIKDGDGLMAYLKKSSGSWSVIFYGTAATEEDLVKLGMPADTARKFLD